MRGPQSPKDYRDLTHYRLLVRIKARLEEIFLKARRVCLRGTNQRVGTQSRQNSLHAGGRQMQAHGPYTWKSTRPVKVLAGTPQVARTLHAPGETRSAPGGQVVGRAVHGAGV